MSEVLAIGPWRSNAELIVACRDLGYLSDEATLDPTFGLGRFWSLWRPAVFVASDLDVARSPVGYPVDFCAMPWLDGSFRHVVFDPPYKLNGTGGSHGPDAAYGVANSVRWQDRMRLCRDGIVECLRVLDVGGVLLVKCQDQVCSGRVRWQTIEFSCHAEAHGARLVDMLHLVSYRAQPVGRRQVHARRNYSTMLVLEKVAW